MQNGEVDGRNWILEKCGLHGQIAVIVGWYCDGKESPADDLREMQRLIGEIPYLLGGRFDLIDLFSFQDALGAWPSRTPALEKIYQVLTEAWTREDGPIVNVVFDPYFEEWVEENI